MIISRTPYRVSFFGGGTDYPAWYKENGGQVLSTTIDKFLYISCRYLPPFFEHRLRLVYSRIESCQRAQELTHPTARETLRFLNIDSDLEIHYDGDLPSRSGVGSSSAFTVGLLHALYTHIGETSTPKKLASESIHIEQNIVGEQVGSQDQVSAAHGGLNRIQFLPDGRIMVDPIPAERSRIDALETQLMLFYTGIKRTAANVANTYVSNVVRRQNQLRKMHTMVDDAFNILTGSSDLNDFGRLLHEGWMEKRSLSSQVSNPYVDDIYSNARSAGALGGKLTGAGGGGMLLLYVPLDKQEKIKSRLSKLIHVPIRFHPSGSQIIFQDEDQRYRDGEKFRTSQPVSFVELREIDF